jgi:DNA-directed RNA polymerase subunit RPC12/RpoP
MRNSAHNCESCGSANLRLARAHSSIELIRASLGSYPFRCMDCNHRFWINIWLFSKLTYAKCPRCLGRELTDWPPRGYHLSTWKKLLMTFGAHRYRCPGCRYNFLSFRRSETVPSGGLHPAHSVQPENLPEQAPAPAAEAKAQAMGRR